MPLFERPPLETLAPAKDRWTPLYLEHGRLEVDDSSVKWISATGLLCRLPVATISALILGPGTTVTHAAMKACAESNTPVCWTGEESLRFYAFGLTPNHTNDMPRLHAEAWADKRRRTQIARAMFKMRFPDLDVETKTVKELRGMEGLRVRAFYAEMGLKHGVTWKGRNYDRQSWDMTVIVANDTPPAVRGILKRWFVEPRPNVFVGTVNRRTRDKVLDYVKRNAQGMSLLILTSEPNCQGFKIERWGRPDRRDTEISGLWLVAERWDEEAKQVD